MERLQQNVHNIRALLDDPSPSVQKHLLSLFKQEPECATIFLSTFTDNEDLNIACFAKYYLKQLSGQVCGDPLTRYIYAFNYQLEEAYWLIEQAIVHQLSHKHGLALLNRIAHRSMELMCYPNTIMEHCKVINRVLFHEFNFRPLTHKNPYNLFLSHTLATKKGHPASIALLYVLVAQRCGIDLDLIPTREGFMIASYLEEDTFFLDPATKGNPISSGLAKPFLPHPQESDYAIKESLSLPSSLGDILKHYCLLLSQAFNKDEKAGIARLLQAYASNFEDVYTFEASEFDYPDAQGPFKG